MFPSFTVIAVTALQRSKRPASHRLRAYDPGDRPTLPFIVSHACDRVLVDRKQFGFSSRTSTPTIGARETPGTRVLERAKGRAAQPSGSNRAKSGRGESGFRSGRVVETSDEPPSTFVPRGDIGLAIMIINDDGVLRGLNEGEERKGHHPVYPSLAITLFTSVRSPSAKNTSRLNLAGLCPPIPGFDEATLISNWIRTPMYTRTEVSNVTHVHYGQSPR